MHVHVCRGVGASLTVGEWGGGGVMHIHKRVYPFPSFYPLCFELQVGVRCETLLLPRLQEFYKGSVESCLRMKMQQRHADIHTQVETHTHTDSLAHTR